MEVKEMESVAAMQKPLHPVNEERLRAFVRILEQYNSGRKMTTDRIQAAEQWWKLRNVAQAQKQTQLGKDGSFSSQSGWLHNVITSKHADAMDAFPGPVFLPREARDKDEAKKLDAIVPCILEQNEFEETYSDVMWQKCKTGTGVYKVIWDPKKLGGLGDISISCVNLLNIYWQPEVRDIQKSRYIFQTEIYDKEQLEEMYPEIKGKLKGQSFVQTKFLLDEHANSSDQVTVIEVYYKKIYKGRPTVHYCKFVGDQILYATENETEPTVDANGTITHDPMALTGLYDHGMYPFVFDALYPIEGSPCGYGYVDLCQNPQIAIDLLKSSFVKNAMNGSVPRYFSRTDGNVKESEFLDLSKPIIHVSGNVDEATLRPVNYNALPGNYINLLQDTVNELRETSGNTETAAGTGTPSGVTAAAAIAALQQASGKGSRDSGRGSYRAFRKVVNMVMELIRQFFDLPRQFRITGDNGGMEFTSYTNQGLKPQGMDAIYEGAEQMERVPAFDISIEAQKKDAYTSIAQNELAMQFYQMGFFAPQQAEQALMCLDMMDFDGKEEVMRKIDEHAKLIDTLANYMQMCLKLSPDPALSQAILADMQEKLGVQMAAPPAVGGQDPTVEDPAAEHPTAAKARQQTAEAPMPT